MTSCPDLSTLEQSPGARQEHLSSCTSCRILFALREGGEEEFGAACETAEALIAVASDAALNAIDQQQLTNHLETCGRCCSLACGLLLGSDAAAEAESAVAVPVASANEMAGTAGQLLQPANDQRKLMFLGVGLLAVAAALLLIFRGLGASEESPTNDFAARVVPQESTSKTPTAETPAAETPAAETPAAETPAAETPILPKEIVGSESIEEESATGASRPTLPVQNAPAQSTVTPPQLKVAASALEQAREAVRQTEYRKGLRLAKEILDQEPGNQDANIVAAIAACNLKSPKQARRYVSQIESTSRRTGLHQICKRLGVALQALDDAKREEPVEKSALVLTSKQKATVLSLVETGEAAVRNEEYGEGSRLCRKALEVDRKNQRAMTVCAIAACNLKRASLAGKYIRRVESSARRSGLTQICLRLGVDPRSEAE